MSREICLDLDTEKYRTRIDEGFGVESGFALYDDRGRVLGACGPDYGEDNQFAPLNDAIRQAVANVPAGEVAVIRDTPVPGVARQTLPVMLAGEEYYLQGVYLREGAKDGVDDAMELVLLALAEIGTLNIELDDMADDLSARHEELNLFYGLDDLVEIKDVTRGRKALYNLAENCIRYLNIEVASIYITSADIDVKAYAGEPPVRPPLFQEKVAKLRDRLITHLIGKRNSLILNDADRVQTLSEGMLHYKIAAAPIFSSGGDVLGYLLLQRHPEDLNFFNSDLRLMRVLAEQAAAIVSSSYDPVTGLLNREGLVGPLNSAIRDVRERGQQRSLILLDLDQFRMVNDTAGRDAGDELLRQFALHLRALSPDEQTIARVESDKFAWLVRASEARDAWLAASAATRSLAETGFRYQDKRFEVTASAGIVEIYDELVDANEALVLGAIACDVAKKQGAGGIFIYDATSPAVESVRSAIDWVPHIRTALENNAFELFAQQIAPLGDAPPNHVHYELLLRLRAEDGSTSSPFQLINAAEIYNLMTRIDQWVFESAMQELRYLKETYPDLDIRFSINMSGQSVTDDFFGFLRRMLIESHSLVRNINIEITETAVVSNLSTATRLIESLRAIGVTFSLDDFGTGMSSFGYLRDLPIDYLKIDGTFVKHIAEDPVSLAMVESIHKVGHIMGLKTVAEYVENEAILNKLRDLGVDYAQGYVLSKPAPVREQVAHFHNVYCAAVLNDVSFGS